MLPADGTPYVLEFNCRFGDPEAQAILPGLPKGATKHLLDIARRRWRPKRQVIAPTRAAVTTVLAARGYPEKPERGAAIQLPKDLGPDVVVFHAGTARDADGTIRTAGGRVLSVTGLAAPPRPPRPPADAPPRPRAAGAAAHAPAHGPRARGRALRARGARRPRGGGAQSRGPRPEAPGPRGPRAPRRDRARRGRHVGAE